MVPILLTFWPFMETLLKNNKKYLGKCFVEDEVKIQRNVMSAMNAIGSVILSLIYIKTKNSKVLMAALLYPIIFYMYDIFYLFFNKKSESLNYMLHHLAAIYILQCVYLTQGNSQTILLLSFICSELSNLSLYYVYYFLKINKNQDQNIEYYKKLMKMKIVQLSMYGFLRIFVCGYLFYKGFNFFTHKPIMVLSIIMIYFMSVYWLQNQVKGYFKTKKLYNNLLNDNV